MYKFWENKYTPRKVTVYSDEGQHDIVGWYPREHLPKCFNPATAPTKEVEHNAEWPDGQEKFLHRIDIVGGKEHWWYCRPEEPYEESVMIAMIANAKEEGYRDH